MPPTIPPTDATSLDETLLPPAPPPNVQALHGPALYPPGSPFQYGRTGPIGSQHHAAGMGMNAPQLYYGAQPPFHHHGNAGPWGYIHYPPSAFPNPVPRPGDLHSSSAPVQASETTNQVAQSGFQPKRNYPNKLISEGGTSHSIVKRLTADLYFKFGSSPSRFLRTISNVPLKQCLIWCGGTSRTASSRG